MLTSRGVLADLRLIDGPALRASVRPIDAIRALQQAVRDGFDPDDDLPRTIVDVPHGQLLLMPAAVGALAGQKLATVSPANPDRGLDRIQAVYVVLDGETLRPLALLDGTELTAIRTPAVSAALVDVVAPAEASELVVFGTGPQGIRHVEALHAIRDVRRVTFIGRDAARRERAVADVARLGLEARAGTPDDVAGADLVVCATTATAPLFADGLVADHATVVAVGSHEPRVRELPGALLGRAQVIVETERVALAEAGDVVLAIEEGHLRADDLVPAAAILTGRIAPSADRPRVVKTCGMGWQDLAVAALAIAPDASEER